jgi:hypothetical protein
MRSKTRTHAGWFRNAKIARLGAPVSILWRAHQFARVRKEKSFDFNAQRRDPAVISYATNG